MICTYTLYFICHSAPTPCVFLYYRYEQLSRSQQTGWSNETSYGNTGEGAGPGSAQRLSLDEIRQEQQQMISEQDKGLENLSRALRRQAEVGMAMQDEITEHNGKKSY